MSKLKPCECCGKSADEWVYIDNENPVMPEVQ